MPRLARLDVAGALHHIMVRGIDKETIFANNLEYRPLDNRPTHLGVATSSITRAIKKMEES